MDILKKSRIYKKVSEAKRVNSAHAERPNCPIAKTRQEKYGNKSKFGGKKGAAPYMLKAMDIKIQEQAIWYNMQILVCRFSCVCRGKCLSRRAFGRKRAVKKERVGEGREGCFKSPSPHQNTALSLFAPPFYQPGFNRKKIISRPARPTAALSPPSPPLCAPPPLLP